MVHARFEHPVVRSFVLWLGLATIQDPRRPGTGALPSAITPGGCGSAGPPRSAAPVRCRPRWSASSAATAGSVVTSAPVAAIGVSGGRADSVTTVDGRRIAARRAVVSGAHLARLAGDARPSRPRTCVAARDTWRPGLSVFAVHAALRPT